MPRTSVFYAAISAKATFAQGRTLCPPPDRSNVGFPACNLATATSALGRSATSEAPASGRSAGRPGEKSFERRQPRPRRPVSGGPVAANDRSPPEAGVARDLCPVLAPPSWNTGPDISGQGCEGCKAALAARRHHHRNDGFRRKAGPRTVNPVPGLAFCPSMRCVIAERTSMKAKGKTRDQ